MPKRAAIYARYSTDLQEDKSIEDQAALCRAFAARQGFEVIPAIYADRALSGASLFGRSALAQMMHDAETGHFDVLLTEMSRRISRDIADLSTVHKALTFLGIPIFPADKGGSALDSTTTAIDGLVAQLEREGTAKMVHRGMAGLIHDGKSAGGRAYGYRPHPRDTGLLEVVPEEAAIILEIYTRYIAGETPRQIAGDLNARDISAPRGERWAANTLNGNGERGSGILANNLYRGVRVWNRVKMLKNPKTGKRVSRPNPTSEWKTADLDETIQIVSDDLWHRAQAVKTERSTGVHPAHTKKAPKRLLSGLLKCGACGGGMGSKGKDKTGKTRIQCARHAESGDCPDARSYNLEDIERDVVARIAGEFRAPRIIEAYIEEFQREFKALTASIRIERDRIERRIAKLDGEAQRSFDLMTAGKVSGERAERKLQHIELELESERAKLVRMEQPAPLIALHPTALEKHLGAIESLRKELATNGQSDAAQLLRAVIDNVTLHPQGQAKNRWTPAPRIEILGKLESLIGAPAIPSTSIGGMGGSGGGT